MIWFAKSNQALTRSKIENLENYKISEIHIVMFVISWFYVYIVGWMDFIIVNF